MNWRIEEKEAFEVFGIERIFDNDETGKVPDFWTECHNNGEYERLFQATGRAKATCGPCVINAVCGYCEPGENAICAFVKDGCNTDGYKVAQIPKTIWAIFRSDETDTIGLQIDGGYPITAFMRLTPEDELSSFNILNDLSSPV